MKKIIKNFFSALKERLEEISANIIYFKSTCSIETFVSYQVIFLQTEAQEDNRKPLLNLLERDRDLPKKYRRKVIRKREGKKGTRI